MQQSQYKLFGIVTNRDLPGNELITWHRERCGDSEKVHSIQKQDLAGGQFPSNKFGANAAWWQIMILAFNLNTVMKSCVLPRPLKTKRLKALRFDIIGIAGRFVQHARSLELMISGSKKVIQLFKQIRKAIIELAALPNIKVNTT